MPDRCTSSAGSGEYVCCLDKGHDGHHKCRKYGNPRAATWAAWDDHDADDEDYACSHTEIERLEVKTPDDRTSTWRCVYCGDVLLEVEDDENYTTTVEDLAAKTRRKVRYINLSQSLIPRSAVTDMVDYAPISLARTRPLRPKSS